MANNSIRNYEVKIIGTKPLLMHYDNVEWADAMDEWRREAKSNNETSKAGDDRTPPRRWIGCCYNDGTQITLPSDNLARVIMEGGSGFVVPGGRSGKTFKSQTQSGMMVDQSSWPLVVNGSRIPWAKILEIASLNTFQEQAAEVIKLGFMLYVKRAKIGQSKHIRVRPRFDIWEASGTISVWDDMITDEILTGILNYAGRYKGLCDWRPGGRTPGPYGTFDALVTRIA